LIRTSEEIEGRVKAPERWRKSDEGGRRVQARVEKGGLRMGKEGLITTCSIWFDGDRCRGPPSEDVR
jgi:hypothetical protein